MKRCAVLSLLCLVALPALAAEPAQTRDFSDWHAGCSSIAGACAGWTGSDAGEGDLVVRRANATQVDWELGLRLPASSLVAAQTLKVRVGDLRETLQRGRDWYEGALAGEVILVDADKDSDDYKGSKLLAAMAKADSLQLDVGVAVGPRHHFSLRGLKATLLWIDASQGKKDSWPIIQAPASMPGVAPAIRRAQRRYVDPAVIADVATLPSAVRQRRMQAGGCAPLAEAADGDGYQVQWLDAHTALFSVPCELTAQEPLDLHVVAHAPDFADAKVVEFPVWDERLAPPEPLARPLATMVPTLALPTVLPVFSRLQLRQQDNHGGLEQSWRWDGRAMQLIEVRQMRLHGETEGPWQVLWQALAVNR